MTRDLSPDTYYANSIKLKPTTESIRHDENTGRRQNIHERSLSIIASAQEPVYTANENLIKLPNQFDFNERVCAVEYVYGIIVLIAIARRENSLRFVWF